MPTLTCVAAPRGGGCPRADRYSVSRRTCNAARSFRRSAVAGSDVFPPCSAYCASSRRACETSVALSARLCPGLKDRTPYQRCAV